MAENKVPINLSKLLADDKKKKETKQADIVVNDVSDVDVIASFSAPDVLDVPIDKRDPSKRYRWINKKDMTRRKYHGFVPVNTNEIGIPTDRGDIMLCARPVEIDLAHKKAQRKKNMSRVSAIEGQFEDKMNSIENTLQRNKQRPKRSTGGIKISGGIV